MTHNRRSFVVAVIVLVASSGAIAQSGNLLRNPRAANYADSWQLSGDARLDYQVDNRHFVVRNGGSFRQDVTFGENIAGSYVVFVGLGSSERVNDNGVITGLPYLYGYMMTPDRRRILGYLQGQQMLLRAESVNVWGKMWGVFHVPSGTGRIRFFLNQALAKGTPYNGSAARFDDLGLYLFATESEARKFIAAWLER